MPPVNPKATERCIQDGHVRVDTIIEGSDCLTCAYVKSRTDDKLNLVTQGRKAEMRELRLRERVAKWLESNYGRAYYICLSEADELVKLVRQIP